MLSKVEIESIIRDVLGHMIVEDDTVNPDVISPSEVTELTDKLHEAIKKAEGK